MDSVFSKSLMTVEELVRKLLLSAVVVLIDEGSPLQVCRLCRCGGP